ncbi:L,D-transpeptidase [Gephyromycinifex aptenodytis]|uniref:L,D-transpeptidase n=1 Tax=Gephyromycinifex aptenodytis TaxID=2716227 RepID=UPI001D01FE6A|nr:Ig-like domain-containing protein [Gephyromycinifex aptenodytis]
MAAIISGAGTARSRSAASVVALAGVIALTGCQAGMPLAGGDASSSTTPPPPPPAKVSFSIADGQESVRPDEVPTVSVADGDLVSVRLLDPKGNVVPGTIGTDGTWTVPSSTRLAPNTPYTLAATARGASGEIERASVSFTTLKPKVDATYWVIPDGPTVGVGMPVMVTFDSGVASPQMRADVERRMKITTVPAQKGSWGWVDDRQLMWRPASYWKPGTKITVNAPLTGVQTGESKWITKDKGATFTIANRARISTVDLAQHVMTVREDGKIVGTYPISAGRPVGDWETRSGTKIITEKQSTYLMDAATLGLEEDDPNYYQTEVRHAMRVTNTGEFLHGAPWSVWAQGRRNVSHGCVNLGPRDAKSNFDASLVGDVVDFKGSKRKMKPSDGVPVWLYTWPEWQARSALAKKPVTPDKGTAAPTARGTVVGPPGSLPPASVTSTPSASASTTG